MLWICGYGHVTSIGSSLEGVVAVQLIGVKHRPSGYKFHVGLSVVGTVLGIASIVHKGTGLIR